MHSAPRLKNTKGFTLVEIIIVIALMAFLAIAAIGRTISAQREFAFLENYRQVMSQLRQPRLQAVTNLAVRNPEYEECADDSTCDETAVPPQHVAPYYGVHIERNTEVDGSGLITSDQYIITTFVDQTGSALLEYDLCDPGTQPFCDDNTSVPVAINGLRYRIEFISSDQFSDPDTSTFHELEDSDPSSGISSSYTNIFYAPPYSESVMYSNITGISSNPAQPLDKHLIIRFSDIRDPELSRYIVIFTSSGIVEGFYESDTPDLTL